MSEAELQAKAELLLQEALRVERATRGHEHPGTSLSMSNPATPLRDLGKLAKAVPPLLEALGMRRTILGDEHPLTFPSLSNLATGLPDQGKLAVCA